MSSVYSRPSTSVVATNVDAISKMVTKDRLVTYREVQESLAIDMKAIHIILHDHLKVRKFCSRWIPQNFTEAQKQDSVKGAKNA